MPQELIWDRTRVFTVWDWRLTAWSMTSPVIDCNSSKLNRNQEAFSTGQHACVCLKKFPQFKMNIFPQRISFVMGSQFQLHPPFDHDGYHWLKVKGKGRFWVLQHCCLEAYCTLTRMSSFIHLQRRCTHQAAWETSVSEWRNYTWNF